MTLEDQTKKTIYLLRHCLALPSESGEDKSRKLAPRGVEDSVALGKIMGVKNYSPSLALCSTALRTKQTLDGLMERISISSVDMIDQLYSGSVGDYLHILQNVDEGTQDVLVVGHNPSIAMLANALVGFGGQSLLKRLQSKYDPGTLATIVLKSDRWADVQFEENEIIYLVDPLDYNAPASPARWT